LVAGILRAMGYKTRISPPGSDRGKDVEASSDGLGLTDPRIIAEVKHKGLYVSTGGFTKEARYEAERASNNQVSLIDSAERVNLIINYYDNFLMQKLDPFFLSGNNTGLNRLQEIACQTITI
jgi:restriction system protein